MGLQRNNLLGCGNQPSRNPTLAATDGMQIRGYGLSSLSGVREKPAESPYAWNDAIHKLTKGV